jgi:hypothetical protein
MSPDAREASPATCLNIPALRVTLLLNTRRKRGDTTAAEQLIRKFADRFWSTEWPDSSRPAVFFDPRASTRTARPVSCRHIVAVDESSSSPPPTHRGCPTAAGLARGMTQVRDRWGATRSVQLEV